MVRSAVYLLIVAACGSATPQSVELPAKPAGHEAPPVQTAGGADAGVGLAISDAAVPIVTPDAQPLPSTALRGAPLEGVVTSIRLENCGGALMGPQRRPEPLAGRGVLVHAGSKNLETPPIAELVSAQDGSFALDVKPGSYCIVLAGRGARPDHDACRRGVWDRCDEIVDVPMKAPVEITEIKKTCFNRSPCDPPIWQGSGPPPQPR